MRWMSTRRFWTAAYTAAVFTSALSAQQIARSDLLNGLADPARWLTYSGDYSGRRHSPLTEITPANAARLVPQWTFQTGLGGHKFEASPLVIDGILYVTGPLSHAWDVPDPRNWQGSGNRSVVNMFIDLGHAVTLTDEQFQQEMDARREKLKLTANDVPRGCPLCMIVPPAPRPTAQPRQQQ